MTKQITEIRKKLRLAMNGITSSTMREKGINYKLNFGVPVMTLRKIANDYAPNAALAEELWKENTRELKILATLIQPPNSFTKTLSWVNDIENLELAEQASMNLFSKTPDAPDNALKLIQSKEITFGISQLYPKICGYLIYARLFMADYQLNENNETYFTQVANDLDSESLILKNAVLTSLKKLGRQSIIHAKDILARYETKNAVYEDLKFEFDYYS